MSVSTPTPAVVTTKANLWQSMALGGAAASFAVNFTHPIVRSIFVELFVGGGRICTSDERRKPPCHSHLHISQRPYYSSSMLSVGNGKDSYASQWCWYRCNCQWINEK